jgi:1-phosphofructokinase family hexose kinase
MIITVTLNPAMDNIIVLDELKLNVTNRIKRQFFCIGGKGTHLSINLSILGVRSIALGASFGNNGSRIIDELKSYKNIDVNFVHSDEGDSRMNIVLVDKEANCTLISQKGKALSDEILDELLERYISSVGPGDYVCISGDASNTNRPGLQHRLIDIAKQKGSRLFLDSSGEFLREGVKEKPFLVKPNVDELSSFCGREIGSESDIITAMKEMAAFGVPNIVVSMGKDGCIALAEDGRLYRVTVPDVKVRNTVGCGDAFVSGLLAGFENKLDMVTLLKRASAISSAAAMDESTVGFDPGLVEELAAQVGVEML